MRNATPYAAAWCLLLTLGTIGSAARQRSQAPTSPAEAGLDLVVVDFLALGSDGRPLPDLKTEEVTLKVDGRTRTIRSLQLITVADSSPDNRTSSDRLPPPYGTSAASPSGRALILALDDDSFQHSAERSLKESVDRFLSSVSTQDRVSLVTMPYGGVKVPLTTDHARVRLALSRIVGQATTDQSGSDMACRTRRTLETLIGFLETLRGVDGPTTMMFFSSGLAAPRRDAPVTLAPGACELTTDHFQQVGAAAAEVRASFYVIQPEDLIVTRGTPQTENIAGFGFTGSDNPLAGLEHLAGVTGAHRLHLSEGAALNRILRETSAYYAAALAPERSDANGRNHRLDVRVLRPDIVVRARPAINFAQRASRLGGPAATTPRDMLVAETGFHDLPLRASAYVLQEADPGKVKIVAIAEPIEPSVKLTSAAVGVFDASGRYIGRWTASAGDLEKTPLMAAMIAPAGRCRLRVAAIDASGRRGTADYELEAEVTRAGALTLSSIVLGLSRDGGFIPKLQFGAEPVALAHVEIYGGSPGVRVSAMLELASTLNGAAMFSVPLAIEPAEPVVAGGNDVAHYLASGAVPIGALPSGDFIVRAIVGIEDQPSARVARTLRKVTR